MTTKISTDNIQAATLTQIGSAVPKISSVSYSGNDTATDPAGGQTVTVNGSGFNAGATVYLDGSVVAVVTVVSSTQVTFTAPAKSAGTYSLYVINTDGGTAIYVPGVSYSGTPTWSNAAGSLGTQYEYTSVSKTVVATGDAPITYSLYSGTLPTGATLFSNGVISGTAPASSGSTTYSFTIRATDAQNQDTDRAFSLTIDTDVVTWSSPADQTAYAVSQNIAIANVTLAATSAAGFAVSYAANTLPNGVSISGNTITGTPTAVESVTSLLTATAATTGKSATRTISWTVNVAGDTYWYTNSLLVNSEPTANVFVADASTNNLAITVSGDTKPYNFNPYTSGYYSAYLDGSGDYIDSSTATTIGTGDFTAEGWYWLDPTQPDIYTGFITSASSSGGSIGIVLRKNLCWIGTGSSTGSGTINPSASIPSAQWFHLAMTRSSNTVRVFVNGAVVGSSFTSTDNIASTSYRFGCNYTETTAYGLLKGYVSNARIIAGTALYTAAFTPGTSPFTAVSGTQLLVCRENRFIDSSGNSRTVTPAGDTAIKSFSPFAANSSYSTYGSGYFDGTGDYLSAPSNAVLTLTGDFTVEFWVYCSGTYNNQGILGGAATNIGIYTDSSGYFQADASNSNFAYNSDSTRILDINAWTHVAVTRSGSTIYIFKNGVSRTVSTVGTPGTATYNFSAGTIGQYGSVVKNALGYIADMRIVNGTAVYTTAFTPPTSPLTAVANTSLLTLQTNQPITNSTFLDASGTNLAITRYGNATAGTVNPYGDTWSNYFDGSTGYLSVPANSEFNFGTGDFTVEWWQFWNAVPGTYGTLYSNNYATAPNFTVQTASGLAKYIVYMNGTSATITESSSANLGQWYHYAVVRSGTTVTIYRNGTSTGSVSYSGNVGNSSATQYIGYDAYYISRSYISNFRVVKGTAVYTTTFTPSTSPLTAIAGTSLLTCQDSRFIDKSPNNFTITRTGTVTIERYSPFPLVTLSNYYSTYFDGTGDYLALPANAAFSLTGDFTFEAWVFPTGTNASAMPIIEIRTSSANATGISFLRTANALTLNVYTNGNFVGASTSSLVLNSWNHVALVRSGSASNNCTYYIGGVACGTFTSTASFTDGSTTGPKIGGSTSAGENWIGYISNLRITKGQALYTSNFTPSTTPLTTTSQSATASNVSLLTCQSNTLIDNSTNAFTITANGDARPLKASPFTPSVSDRTSYTPTTFSGSVYFDGTGDYLSATTASSFGTNDFTIECWVYNSGAVTNSGVFMLASAVLSTSVGISLAYYSGWQLSYAAGTTTSGGTSAANTWYHVAVVRSSSTTKLYINGVSTISVSDSTNYSFTVLTLGGYYSSSQLLTGYISDFRIVNGTALYTANFYPGATPLTAIKNTTFLLDNRPAVIDWTMNNNMETVGDAKVVASTRKYGAQSIYFDGTGDYLEITKLSPAFYYGLGNFTLECWYYVTSASTTYALFGKGPSDAADEMLVALYSGQYYIDWGSGGDYFQGGSYTANTWHHFALVRNGANLTAYHNGTSILTTATVTSYNFSNSYTFKIGMSRAGTWYYSGYVDDVRISRYARYTSNFTPSTTALITK